MRSTGPVSDKFHCRGQGERGEMSKAAVVFSLDELSALVQAGPAPVEFSPMGDSKALVLKLEDCESADAARFATWLRSLVCPVIGIGNDDALLADACDVLLEQDDEADELVERIDDKPIASSVFVQVLRATENMPMPQALSVESMAYATLQAGPEYSKWLARLKPQLEMQDDSGPAVVLERDGSDLYLELNRPSNRNAMSVEMRDALNDVLGQVLLDEEIRSVQITGRGKCFSTGGDLTEFGTVPDAATGHIVRGLSVPGALLAQCAERVNVLLHGACIGSGLEFPAFAGQVTAKTITHFLLPEISMGLIPGAGGCISIARRIGRQRCGWLALSGQRIKSQQALEWGLIDDVID